MRWIGGGTYQRGVINVRSMANDEAALARYIDILRRGYADEKNAAERRELARVGTLAQDTFRRNFGRNHQADGWQDRAAIAYAEAGV